ncbi:uncharacterized protein SAPINGB_P001061 [Magnusiomyces paraingens]|uniref:PiggyBac transposable element-derived protein domain-containing protein n=1 Tax=Magnusiomyces paraingens TaxID=2606893 RepID=A0A5E8B9Z7_9ASCO|nr:uncharacterized protein SAPINGB_P001061 [Saprochaete ingens]VVT46130.1 unnamed protein product [Saprochaete ingens]
MEINEIVNFQPGTAESDQLHRSSISNENNESYDESSDNSDSSQNQTYPLSSYCETKDFNVMGFEKNPEVLNLSVFKTIRSKRPKTAKDFRTKKPGSTREKILSLPAPGNFIPLTRSFEQEESQEAKVLCEQPPQGLTADQASTYYFSKILSNESFNILVHYTNNFAAANTKPDEWTPVTRGEMKIWLGILIYMGNFNISNRRLFWNSSKEMPLHEMREYMTYDRFEEIYKYFHISDYSDFFPCDNDDRKDFTHNDQLAIQSGAGSSTTWEKFTLFARVIKENSQAVFLPGKNMNIDEMTIGFKGRSPFSHSDNKSGSLKKSYRTVSLCHKGYTYDFLFQSSASGLQGVPVRANDETHSFSPTSRGLYQMICSLPFRKHFFVIYMDHTFTNSELFGTLRKLGIGAMGTVRSSSKNFPEEIDVDKREAGKVLKWNHMIGKIVKQKVPEITRAPGSPTTGEKRSADQSKTTEHEINTLGWNDNNLVYLMTTVHEANQNDKDPRTYIVRNRKRPTSKNFDYDVPVGRIASLPVPIVMDDYDQVMKSVGIFDMLRSNYYVSSKTSQKWLPLFFWLLDTSIINSYVLFITQNPTKNKQNIRFNYRFNLSQGLLDQGRAEMEQEVRVPLGQNMRDLKLYIGANTQRNSLRLTPGDHSLVPMPSGRRPFCAECRYSKHEKPNVNIKRTSHWCKICEVPLCKDCSCYYHSLS